MMKILYSKKIKSFIAVLLCFATLFNVACSNKNANNSLFVEQPTNDEILLAGRQTNAEEYYNIGQTIHNYNIKDGNNVFVKDLRSDYVIVYPSISVDSKLTLAITELQNFIQIATGVKIVAKSDAEISTKDKILSIGYTEQAKSENTLAEKMSSVKLGTDGYVIQTIGSSVYMVGNTNYANLYAVYEFLHWQFGYEAYSSDTYYITSGITECNLKEMDIVDVPDFESRTPTNQSAHVDRLRSITYTTKFNTYNNKFVHNFWHLIPPEKYYEEHESWFTGTGATDQLCLNAHGNDSERQALIETVYDEMVERLIAQPSTDWIAFSQNDSGGWCKCPFCTAENDLYDHGSNSAAFATLIRFINEVARKIKVWNQENCPDRDIKIFIYAYGKPNWAPVKVNSEKKPIVQNGGYVAYSDELILEDNVAVFYCGFSDLPIESSAKSNTAGSEDELMFLDSGNSGIDRVRHVHAVMTDPTMYIWTYSATFGDYLVPNCVVDTRKINYQYFKSIGAVGIFDQGHFDTQAATHFAKLEEYVSAKLMWNCKLDVEKLIDNFLKYYYKDAYATMKTLFNEYRSYIKYLQDEKEYEIFAATSKLMSKTNFPYQRVQRFLSLIDNAYNAIESLKESDMTLYNELQKKIMLESITWRYLDIKLYPENYTPALLAQMKDEFVFDALYCGIDYCAEQKKTISMFG